MLRIVTSVTFASGGFAAAASLAIGVAAADPDATTISVPDPFGVTFVGALDISYQTGNATEDIAYGHQTLDLNSANFAAPVQQFFLDNVTVDGHPLNLTSNPLIADDLHTTVIDKLESDGAAQQQILLPAIPGTNIESGVIGVHNLGDGYAYEYIDLVGPGTTSLNSNGVDHAVGAFLVTPTGTYDVSHWENGGDYGGQAYLESQLLDYSNPVSDPFGVTLVGNPDITYQTVDVFANDAYGSQTADFNSSDLAPFVDSFFTKNVTVDGHAFNPTTNPLSVSDLTTHVIDKVQYNGLFDGFTDQQILLPSIDGTNIEHGVIDIENLGNGYSYDTIDLVESGNTNAVGAWLVTPTGAFDVSPWAVPEASMFDAAAFDPSAYFPADGLVPPPGFDF
jgi:hypothetical protein